MREHANRQGEYLMPNAERAEVSLTRLHAHVFDRHLDEFKRWGYTRQRAKELAQALVDSAIENPYDEYVWTSYGDKYRFYQVWLPTPVGIEMPTEIIWVIFHGEENPKLVTAYPDMGYAPSPRQRRR